MWIFSVFFLPTILILYILTHANKNNFTTILFGIGCGAVYVVFAILFGSDFRLYPVSFFENFSVNFLQETFLPALIITVTFFLLSKDDLQFKTDKLVLTISSFFCLYIPFRIFFRSETLSVFILFFKPVLLSCFVFGFSFAVKLFIKNFFAEKNIFIFIVSLLCGLGCTVLPAIAEVWWFEGGSTAVWLIFSVIQIAFTVILSVLNHVNIDSFISTKK